MSEYLIQGETLTGIADAIRGKTGGTDPVAVSDMAAQIEGIEVGGGDIDALIDRSLTEIESSAESIAPFAFYHYSDLTSVNFPLATTIGANAFESCTSLVSGNFPLVTTIDGSAFKKSALKVADFPLLTTIGYNVFSVCQILVDINFPVAETVASSAFNNCVSLATADFPKVSTIQGGVFQSCIKLVSLILRNTDSVCSLTSSSAFSSTPIASGTGYIYVPAALIEQYKVATNWSTYAAQFRALEDYTVDGTTTGELDPAKTGT